MTSSGLCSYPRLVDGSQHVPLALETVLNSGAGRPPGAEEDGQRLNIAVVFTSVESTLAALRRAVALASSLRARILLLVPQMVPYPLPLDSPPVLVDWSEERFRRIAGETPVETVVRLYLCRDRVETLKDALRPVSLVVLGGRRKWWPFNREKRLALRLRRAGHEVIFTETE